MASNAPGACCSTGTLHGGETTGKFVKIANNAIEAYVATPPEGTAKSGKAILFLPDIHGSYTNSKLLADNYAANGYLTVLPDLFNGDQAPWEKPGDWDVHRWIREGLDGKHPHIPAVIDPVVEKTIKALKEEFGVTRIFAVGYCFGAKYVVRHLKSGGIDVGFVAHPSHVEEDELAAIQGPFAIAAAQTDFIFPAEKRHKSEEILIKTGLPFQITLYSGVVHGFGVRADPKIKLQKYAKESAFKFALTWAEEHL